MINRILGALAIFMIAGAAFGQSPIEKTAGIYMAYPVPDETDVAAPDGYDPVYISHYGRHGSRWITDDVRYTRITEAFDSLHDIGQLTNLGEDVRGRLHHVTDDALGRSGHLTPLGAEQHRGIGLRMAHNYPEIFNDSATVRAVSSTKARCIMSMMHCLDAIKGVCPGIDMIPTAYDRDMEYIAYTTPEGNEFSSEHAAWRSQYHQFVDSIVCPDRIMGSLIKTGNALSRDKRMDMMMDLYWLASDMQNVDVKEDFYDIFTYEELYNIWRTINARMYVCNGSAPLNEGIMPACAQNLLNKIVEEADSALAAGKPSANLRFGHDTHLLRLLTLMRIDGATAAETDMDRYHEVWRDYELSPMAANLQLVFYADGAGDVLVKLWLNERDATLPIDAVKDHYYRWKDVKKLWEKS